MCKKFPHLSPISLGDIAPPLKFQKRPVAWSYSSLKFISTPLIFGRGLIPCIIVYLPENQNRHFSSYICKQVNVILITVKCDVQSYGWWKDIISVKWIVKASKYKKIEQKHKIHASLIANSKQYNMTTNGAILASELFSFQDTGKWSRVGIMGQRASNTWQFWNWHPSPIMGYS